MPNVSRVIDMLYYPKSKFDKFVGDVYERCLPGFKFFFWNEHVYWARDYGYTLGEKMYHSFGRNPQIKLFAMAQQIHPWGWLES